MADKKREVKGKIIISETNEGKRKSVISVYRTDTNGVKSGKKTEKVPCLKKVGSVSVGAMYGRPYLCNEVSATAKVKEVTKLIEKATGYELEPFEGQRLLLSGEFLITKIPEIVKK